MKGQMGLKPLMPVLSWALTDTWESVLICHFLWQVTEMCQRMKGHMYMVYEQNSDEMQVWKFFKP